MPKISKKFTTIFIVIACVALVYGVKFVAGLSKNGVSTGSFTKVKGNNDAPIKITEFIDFQCPACAQGSQYLKGEIEKYPEAIRLQLKHYPLAMHRYGLLSARYAECAAQQGQFWPFHDVLLARQGNWKRLTDAEPAFVRMASEVNLDSRKLEACLKGEKADKIIEKNKAEGKSLGVRSTPTYVVNGKIIVGKQSLELEITKLLRENGY